MEDPVVLTYQPEHIEKHNKFIRVVLCRDFNHWVCIARFNKPEIHLYDSSNRTNIDNLLGKTVITTCNIIGRNKREFIFKHITTTLQKETLCGFFAIANATALCFGLDPGLIEFDETDIKKHFVDIVYNKKNLSMFPYKVKPGSSTHMYLKYEI